MPLIQSRLDSFSPQELGVNGTLLTAQVVSTVFPIEGFNQMRVRFRLTWVAATTVTFFVETAPRPKSLLAPVPANTWDRVQSTVTGGTGTITMNPLLTSNAVTADENYDFVLGISGFRARITIPIVAGATTDTASMWVDLSVT